MVAGCGKARKLDAPLRHLSEQGLEGSCKLRLFQQVEADLIKTAAFVVKSLAIDIGPLE